MNVMKIKIYKLFISAREHMVQTLPLNFDNSERNDMAKQEKIHTISDIIILINCIDTGKQYTFIT